jgi:dsRNA-specific ribonuclease
MARHSLRFDREEFEVKVGNLLASLQIHTPDIFRYSLAFIHRSILNESTQGYNESNERLEFL